jgi:hypothetical protein
MLGTLAKLFFVVFYCKKKYFNDDDILISLLVWLKPCNKNLIRKRLFSNYYSLLIVFQVVSQIENRNARLFWDIIKQTYKKKRS